MMPKGKRASNLPPRDPADASEPRNTVARWRQKSRGVPAHILEALQHASPDEEPDDHADAGAGETKCAAMMEWERDSFDREG
jgi:hypothetical protein